MARPQHPVQMAVIASPHGVRGELRVKTFTAEPRALGDYGPLFAPDGRRFDVAALRPAKGVVIVRFRQVTTREAAAALAGTPLLVDRSALSADLDANEFYHADLVGLELRDAAGRALGLIVAVHDFGGGDILEARLPDGRTAMLPFSEAAVPEVDVAAGFARVDLVAAGLVEPPEEPSPADRKRPERSRIKARRREPRTSGGGR